MAPRVEPINADGNILDEEEGYLWELESDDGDDVFDLGRGNAPAQAPLQRHMAVGARLVREEDDDVDFDFVQGNAPAQAPLQHHIAIGPIVVHEAVQPRMAIQRQIRDEFEYVTEGNNGYLSLGSWIQGVGRNNKRMPPRVHNAVCNNTCPYEVCGREFQDIKALEQHLVSVQWHAVYLCCGRPFNDENAYEMHKGGAH